MRPIKKSNFLPSPYEITFRVIILSLLLTTALAISNAYLALKLGILTSASIPAAILSMGILRFFKNHTILENNAVQTAASAGEAIAGGIVYTVPALVLIGFWNHFDYWTNVFIALSGGILGVFFSIPLRKILVHNPSLKFPEGRAIAEVLKTSHESFGAKHILLGGSIGAILELFQTGFKLLASTWSFWFKAREVYFSFGLGFSAAMIGAGFLVGQDMATSIFLGAIINWFGALPLTSYFTADSSNNFLQISGELRYIGIGAMLFAGLWTFFKLIKPLFYNIRLSLQYSINHETKNYKRTEKDISVPWLILGIGIICVFLFFFFQLLFPMLEAGIREVYFPTFVLITITYILIIGFLFSVITAYFSAMVGVTASPGSSIIVASVLLSASVLFISMNWLENTPLIPAQLKSLEAIIILIAAILTGIAAIANDNIQDLKVGSIVGATPWKQQLMLLLGVTISSLIIPAVMQYLYNVYGIAGSMPRPNMDVSQSLPAPTAMLLSTITEAVFQNTLPWHMLFWGGGVVFVILVLDKVFNLKRFSNISVLGVAIGMYLPLTSSVPLFIGGLIALLAKYKNPNKNSSQIGTLIACGLVSGAALMDVLLAIPFSILQSPDALRILSSRWDPYALILSIIATYVLGAWIVKSVSHSR